MMSPDQYDQLMQEVRKGNEDAKSARVDAKRILRCLEGDQLTPGSPPGLITRVERLEGRERARASADRNRTGLALGAIAAGISSIIAWIAAKVHL